MTVHIDVPATLSNLGPGYDVLGMAIDRVNRFVIHEGKGDSPGSELVIATAEAAARRFGGSLPAIHIEQHENVPRARGLGSSATARVAGLKLYTLYNHAPDERDALAFLSDAEGHPDNVAPAWLGGLVVCGARPVRLPIPAIGIALCVPALEVETPAARRALPAQHAHHDVVSNLTSLGQLLAGLILSDMDAIRLGVQDRVHQPYRAPLIGPVDAAFAAARQVGGAPFISGSGSTLAAFTHGDAAEVAEALAGPLRDAGIECETSISSLREAGAVVHP